MTTNARASSSFFRLCVLLLCIFGMAWTCRAVLSGHKVRDYTFEEAVRLLQQGHTNTVQSQDTAAPVLPD